MESFVLKLELTLTRIKWKQACITHSEQFYTCTNTIEFLLSVKPQQHFTVNCFFDSDWFGWGEISYSGCYFFVRWTTGKDFLSFFVLLLRLIDFSLSVRSFYITLKPHLLITVLNPEANRALFGKSFPIHIFCRAEIPYFFL